MPELEVHLGGDIVEQGHPKEEPVLFGRRLTPVGEHLADPDELGAEGLGVCVDETEGRQPLAEVGREDPVEVGLLGLAGIVNPRRTYPLAMTLVLVVRPHGLLGVQGRE